MRGAAVWTAACAACGAGYAAEIPRGLGVAEALRLALRQNPSILIQQSQIDINEGAVLQARGQFDPEVVLRSQRTRGIRPLRGHRRLRRSVARDRRGQHPPEFQLGRWRVSDLSRSRQQRSPRPGPDPAGDRRVERRDGAGQSVKVIVAILLSSAVAAADPPTIKPAAIVDTVAAAIDVTVDIKTPRGIAIQVAKIDNYDVATKRVDDLKAVREEGLGRGRGSHRGQLASHHRAGEVLSGRGRRTTRWRS